MLTAFREQKKALLSMQSERDQQEAGVTPIQKRSRLVNANTTKCQQQGW